MAWLHCSTQPVRERWFAVTKATNQFQTISRQSLHKPKRNRLPDSLRSYKKIPRESNPINLAQNHIFDNLSVISLCAQETRDVRAESKLRSTSQKRQSSRPSTSASTDHNNGNPSESSRILSPRRTHRSSRHRPSRQRPLHAHGRR